MRHIPLLAFTAFAAGCSTVRVPVTVLRAPEINLTRYKQVAVARVDAPSGRWNEHDKNVAEDISGRLKQALIENGSFQVVDRKHLDSVLEELKLSGSDLADPESRKRLGKLLTGAVLIFGKVTESSYDERMDTSTYETEKKDSKGNVIGKEKHTRYRLNGKAVLRVTFEVVDTETGQLLKVKNIEKVTEDTNERVDGTPPPLDRAGMESRIRAEAVSDFLKAIAPYKEVVQAPFVTHGDLPQLEMAVRAAKIGDWDQARKSCLEAVNQCDTNPHLGEKACGRAHWNLALVYEYTGEYDKAISHVKKALMLSDEDEDERQLEIKAIERLRDDAAKLAADEAAAKGEASR